MRVDVYEDDQGRRPFDEWFKNLPPVYAIKVLIARGRLEAGTRVTLSRSAGVFTNGGSTGGPACEFTSPSMVTASFCCSEEARSAASRSTSWPLKRDGRITRSAAV
jgi:hypothetical protein